MIIGAVYEVNGEGAVEHTAQVSTFEIGLLCKHWAERLLSIDEMWQVFGQTGSREIREGPYAKSRLSLFSEVLGRQKVDAIVAEVYGDIDFEKEREAYEAWLAQQPDDPSEDAPRHDPPAEGLEEDTLPP